MLELTGAGAELPVGQLGVDATLGPMTEPSRSTRLLEPESEIVRVLAEAGTVEEAAHDVLGALAEWLEWDVALLWVPDDETRLLRCGSSWSGDDPELVGFRRVNERLTFAPDAGLPGRVWSAAQPRWVGDIHNDPDFPRMGIAAPAGLRSATAVPILGADRVLGVIELLSRTVRVPEPEHERALRTVGRQLGHYVVRVRAEERLRKSEERTASIVEAALDCVITMAHDGTVVDFNAAAEATFGYTREEAVGQAAGRADRATGAARRPSRGPGALPRHRGGADPQPAARARGDARGRLDVPGRARRSRASARWSRRSSPASSATSQRGARPRPSAAACSRRPSQRGRARRPRASASRSPRPAPRRSAGGWSSSRSSASGWRRRWTTRRRSRTSRARRSPTSRTCAQSRSSVLTDDRRRSSSRTPTPTRERLSTS